MNHWPNKQKYYRVFTVGHMYTEMERLYQNLHKDNNGVDTAPPATGVNTICFCCVRFVRK